MNYQKTCECCGNTVTAYTISINKGLLTAFMKFAEEFIEKKSGMTKKQMSDAGIITSNSQYTNFHNLQYFGIIENAPNNREVWFLTDFGLAFYHGEEFLMTPVAVMANKSLPDVHEAWTTHGKARRKIYADMLLEWRYKRRVEYQAEKSPQTSFFNKD